MKAGDLVDGRFFVERVLGAGGMGTVFRAHDRATDCFVALKTMLDAGASSFDRFEREARLLAELDDPGVVRFVASGRTHDGEAFMAMEWVDGEDLAQRLARAPLSSSDSIALAIRLATALGAVHARGVVHRDIKPANVLLPHGSLGEAKIVDFGIARRSVATRVRTGTGLIVGTIGYMAPEQARGDKSIDGRVDLFALGCILFECLTGRAAFDGEHAIAVLAKILLGEVPRVRELRPDLPVAVDALVARLLATDAAGRPRDGAAVASELAAIDTEHDRTLPPPLAIPAASRLTHGEMRFVTVILVRHPRVEVSADAPTLAPSRSGELPESGVIGLKAASALATQFGARFEALGDGTLLLLFADSEAPTDQAMRAARTALALAALGHGAALVIATGRGVVSGQLPIGDALDRAAEMLGTGKPGRIDLDATTESLLGVRFVLERAENALILRSERTSDDADRTLLGCQTACVGRDRELRMIGALADECIEVRAPVVALISAGAGMGKSRVRQEILARLRVAHSTLVVWTAQGDVLAQGSPLAMAASLICNACGIAGDEPLELRRTRVAATAARMLDAATAAKSIPFLLELVGAPAPDGETSPDVRGARADPVRMADGIRLAWTTLARQTARDAPLAIVLEDVHWADRGTMEQVDALLASEDGAILVLAFARPDVHDRFPNLWRERSVQEIRLGELPRRACVELARRVLGERLDENAIARIVDRAAGNAFFLEEIIRKVGGRGEAVVDIDALPETVLAMAQSRLATLGDASRRVARAASVFGEVFWRSGVACISGDDLATVDAALVELVSREVIARRSESRQAGEIEFAFRHALGREAAYAMLTESDRGLAHTLAGEWLEAKHDADPRVVAQHFEHGARDAPRLLRAASCWQKAAHRSAARSSLADALEQWSRVVALLQRVPDSTERRMLELGAQLGIGSTEAATRGYSAPEVELAFTRAHEIAQGLGDAPLLVRALVGLYAYANVRGRLDETQAISDRCVAIAARANDGEISLEALRTQWNVAFIRGDVIATRAFVDSGLALLEALGPDRVSNLITAPDLNCRSFDVLALAMEGRARESKARTATLLSLARERDHVYSTAFALTVVTAGFSMGGDYDQVLEYGQEASRIADARGFAWVASFTAMLVGHATAMLGGVDAGVRILEDANARYRKMGAAMCFGYWCSALADVYRLAGRIEDASRAIERGQAFVACSGEGFGSPFLHAAMGRIAVAAGARESIHQSYAAAIAEARATGARAIELLAVTEYSRHLLTVGERASATELLTRTLAGFPANEESRLLSEARALAG